jgi:hypothetical protein
MRTCEGGRDNPFCYHRVATLAAQRNRKARSRYSPTTYAPTALLALLGFSQAGCESVDVYGAPPPDLKLDARADTPPNDASPLDTKPDLPRDLTYPVDTYGIPTPDVARDTVPPSDAVPPIDTRDAGLPEAQSVDSKPDLPPFALVDAYGIRAPDVPMDRSPDSTPDAGADRDTNRDGKTDTLGGG